MFSISQEQQSEALTSPSPVKNVAPTATPSEMGRLLEQHHLDFPRAEAARGIC